MSLPLTAVERSLPTWSNCGSAAPRATTASTTVPGQDVACGSTLPDAPAPTPADAAGLGLGVATVEQPARMPRRTAIPSVTERPRERRPRGATQRDVTRLRPPYRR